MGRVSQKWRMRCADSRQQRCPSNSTEQNMPKKGGKKKKGKTVDWHTIIGDKLLEAAFCPKPEEALRRVQQLTPHEVFPQVVDNANRHGRTALQYAAVRGHEEVVQALLDAQAGLDVTCRFGHSPLHLSAWFGHIRVTQILVDAGATVNIKDRIGETPLHSAAWAGQVAAVELLVTAGAEVDNQVELYLELAEVYV